MGLILVHRVQCASEMCLFGWKKKSWDSGPRPASRSRHGVPLRRFVGNFPELKGPDVRNKTSTGKINAHVIAEMGFIFFPPVSDSIESQKPLFPYFPIGKQYLDIK